MRTFITALKAVAMLLLLPWVPTADDRIQMAVFYRRYLGYMRAAGEARRYWSLCAWLDRASARQQRMNSIKLPEHEEHCRRRWERKFAYQYAAGRVMTLWACYHGLERIEQLLLRECPAVDYWLNHGCIWLLTFFSR